MPQELHIVCCYKCETFQVDIVKKTKKWNCKICGEKQSLKKVYGNGSGKECRLQAQRLNELRKNQEEALINKIGRELNESEDHISLKTDLKQNPPPATSKWTKYADTHSSSTEESSQNCRRRTRSKTTSPNCTLVKCNVQSTSAQKLTTSSEIHTRRRSFSSINANDTEQGVSRKRSLQFSEETYNKPCKIPKLASNVPSNNLQNTSSSKWSKYVSPKITEHGVINQASQKRKHVPIGTDGETPTKKRKEITIGYSSENSTEAIINLSNDSTEVIINLSNDSTEDINSNNNISESRVEFLNDTNKIMDNVDLVDKDNVNQKPLEIKKAFVAVESVYDSDDLVEIQGTSRTVPTVPQKSKLDISNMGPIIPINKNARWNLYFDSDTISEPSSNSSALIELEEDNFEEFEFTSGSSLPCSRRNFELFNTVKSSDDLDSILTM